MNNNVKPVPEGRHTVTPYLIVKNASDAIEFYKKAFGAEEVFRMAVPGAQVGHAELRIGDSLIMLADEAPQMGAHSPESMGGTPVSIVLYVEDADALTNQAIAAGARLTRPVKGQFYGDRMGTLT